MTSVAIFALVAQPLYGAVSMQVASANTATPSTNAINQTNNWAHVSQIGETSNSVTIEFVAPRAFASCFEYRTDGDLGQQTSATNPNLEIGDGRYPSICLNNDTQIETIPAVNFVEVRMVFGAEKDERFDWTTFNVLDPDPTDSHAFNVSGTIYRDNVLNGCTNLTSCYNKEENLVGWGARLYKEDTTGNWLQVSTSTTNSSGNYAFATQQGPGTYHVCEVMKAGWTQNKQTWSGSGYLVQTANQSGDSSEGPWCATSVYDDTQDKSWKQNIGNYDSAKPTGQSTYFGGNEFDNIRYVPSVNNFSFNAVIEDNHSVSRATFLVQKLNTLNNNFEGFCGNWNANSLGSHVLGGSVFEQYTSNVNNCVNDQSKWTDGTYKIFHGAYDSTGNEGKFNTDRKVFIIDGVAPVVNIEGITNGSYLDGVVEIQGEVDDSNARNSYFRIEGPDGYLETSLYTDGRSVHDYSWDTTGLADGDYTIYFEARDKAGNKVGSRSNPGDSVAKVEIKIDNTSPLPPTGLAIFQGHNTDSENLLPEDGYTNDTAIRIDWDPNSEGDIDYYWFGTKSNPYHKKLAANKTHYDGNMTPGNGPYYYSVIAVDKAGNESTKALTYSINIDQDDPLVSIVSVSENPISGEVTIDGTASDAISGIRPDNAGSDDAGRIRLSFRPIVEDNVQGPVKTLFVEVGNDGNWSTVIDTSAYPELTDGNYRVVARANDNTGNSYAASNTAQDSEDVIIDNTAPDVDLVSFTILGNIITPIFTVGVDTGTPLTYSWNGGNPNVTITDLSELMPNFIAALSGSYSFDLTVTDAAGNSTTKTFSFVYSAPIFSFSQTPSPQQPQIQQPANLFSDVAFVPTDDEPEVLGAETNNERAATGVEDEDTSDILGTTSAVGEGGHKIFGIDWYWFMPILLAMIGGFWWMIAAFRRRDQEA